MSKESEKEDIFTGTQKNVMGLLQAVWDASKSGEFDSLNSAIAFKISLALIFSCFSYFGRNQLNFLYEMLPFFNALLKIDNVRGHPLFHLYNYIVLSFR